MLISYNPDRGTVDFRHYVITVKPYGVSKRVRRVLEGASATKKSTASFLDLGNEKDVADFLLRRKGESGPNEDGYESAASSASSAAGDDGDAVSLADDYVGRNNKKGQRRAVRLDEIGPRMELRLVKITEGVPGKEGSVIYHEFGEQCTNCMAILVDPLDTVTKSKKEVAAMKASHAAKEKLRKERREEQERNVQRKKAKGNDGDTLDSDERDGSDGDEDDDAVGVWDDEEDISDGEGSVEGSDAEDSESDGEPEERPAATKKVKI